MTGVINSAKSMNAAAHRMMSRTRAADNMGPRARQMISGSRYTVGIRKFGVTLTHPMKPRRNVSTSGPRASTVSQRLSRAIQERRSLGISSRQRLSPSAESNTNVLGKLPAAPTSPLLSALYVLCHHGRWLLTSAYCVRSEDDRTRGNRAVGRGGSEIRPPIRVQERCGNARGQQEYGIILAEQCATSDGPEQNTVFPVSGLQ